VWEEIGFRQELDPVFALHIEARNKWSWGAPFKAPMPRNWCSFCGRQASVDSDGRSSRDRAGLLNLLSPSSRPNLFDRCGEARRSQLFGHRMGITSSIVPRLYETLIARGFQMWPGQTLCKSNSGTSSAPMLATPRSDLLPGSLTGCCYSGEDA